MLTVTEPGAQPLFSYVDPANAGLHRLAELRATAADHWSRAGDHVTVVAELKLTRSGGGFALDRFICSLQHWPSLDRPAFTSNTMYWRRGGTPTWFEFPDEPHLDGLRPSLEDGRELRVLRYVPTRRFTFLSGGRVTKVKRRSRLADSYRRATALEHATIGSPVRVPALRGIDERCSSYHQDAIEGTAVSDLVRTGADIDDLLAAAGQVHAQLHALPGAGLPVADRGDTLADAVSNADALGWLRRDLGPAVTRARDVLTAGAPAPRSDDLATCHGDFVPSHLYHTADGWTVIDLDLAHRGDRYRDIAMFLAGLPGDIPVLADGKAHPNRLDAAEAAYLSAYEQTSGHRLDSRRLAWHRAAADLHHLGLLHLKDRPRAHAVPRILASLAAQVDRLGDPR